MLESLFNKVAGLMTCSFIKKRLRHKCFPVTFPNFCEFCQICVWLLLQKACFNTICTMFQFIWLCQVFCNDCYGILDSIEIKRNKGNLSNGSTQLRNLRDFIFALICPAKTSYFLWISSHINFYRNHTMSEIFGYYIPAEKWRLNLKIFAISRNFMKILIGDFLGKLFSWDEILNN